MFCYVMFLGYWVSVSCLLYLSVLGVDVLFCIVQEVHVLHRLYLHGILSVSSSLFLGVNLLF